MTKAGTEAKEPETWLEMAGQLDYANLRLDARERDIRLLCLEAERYGIPTILVNPVYVSLAASLARGSGVAVAAAISYPVGAYPPEFKEREIEDAVENGADEIFMMMALGPFTEGLHDHTRSEMEALARAARGRPTRVMTEVALYSDEQKKTICQMAIEAGIDYLVASMGFVPNNIRPATPAEVEQLVAVAHGDIGIVAMGNIESTEQALTMLRAGASRICTEAARGVLRDFGPFPHRGLRRQSTRGCIPSIRDEA